MTQHNLFCISDDELAEERAVLDTLPSSFALVAPEPLPELAPTIKRTDARRLPYTGPFPRKRHYHRCPKCKDHGSNGCNCYKQRCTLPVLLSGPCSWCR